MSIGASHPVKDAARRRRPAIAAAWLALALGLTPPCAPSALAETAAAPAEAPPPVDPQKVLAVIDGLELRKADIELARDLLPTQARGVPFEAGAWLMLEKLTDVLLAAKAAEASGLAASPEVVARVAYYRNRVLEQAQLSQAVDPVVTDEALHKDYDTLVAAWEGKPQVKARHILVKTRDEATALIAALDGGADFAKLADETSIDRSSEGGDLGTFGEGQMVEPFWQAALATEPGTYTKAPVETRFGWHVIQVEARTVQPPPSFDEAKGRLREVAQAKAIDAERKRLRDAAKIELRDPVVERPEQTPQ